MKKLLTVPTGSRFRRICGSMLIIVSTVLFSFVFWIAPIAHADKPTPTATPDFNGTNDPAKCTICHCPPGKPPNAHTLVIGCSAVQAHLRHHPLYSLAPCPCQP